MSYSIEVVDLKPQPVLIMEAKVAPEGLGEALAELLPTVHGYVAAQGGDMSGMPFLRYLSMSDEWHIAAGVPVAEALPGTDEIIATELPGGPTATTLFLGPYQEVGTAWDALFAWCGERGRSHSQGGWDVYENDPTEVANPTELRTRIYQPLD
ncbi:MAG: GyrI-like domain-containing protein [Pseudomonadota bacterium]